MATFPIPVVPLACRDAQEEKTWSLGELKSGRTHHCSHTSHSHQGRSDVQNQAQLEGELPSWGPHSPPDVCPTQLWHFPFPTSRPHLEAAFYPKISYKKK